MRILFVILIIAIYSCRESPIYLLKDTSSANKELIQKITINGPDSQKVGECKKYILEITNNINLETENSQTNKFNVSAIQGAEIFSADDDCLVCDQSIKLNIEVDSKDLSLNNKYLKNFCVKTLKDNLKEIVIEAKGSGFDVGKKVVKIITNDTMCFSARPQIKIGAPF